MNRQTKKKRTCWFVYVCSLDVASAHYVAITLALMWMHTFMSSRMCLCVCCMHLSFKSPLKGCWWLLINCSNGVVLKWVFSLPITCIHFGNGMQLTLLALTFICIAAVAATKRTALLYLHLWFCLSRSATLVPCANIHYPRTPPRNCTQA